MDAGRRGNSYRAGPRRHNRRVTDSLFIRHGPKARRLRRRRLLMSLHVFVRFEPRSGNEQQLRDELTGILAPTRTETGCIAIQLYESTRDPFTLIIHSRWVDEAAFDAHA